MRYFAFCFVTVLVVPTHAQIAQQVRGQAGSVFHQQNANQYSGNLLLNQADNGIGGHGAASTGTDYVAGLFTSSSHGCCAPPANTSDLAGGDAQNGILDRIEVRSGTLSLGTAIDFTICVSIGEANDIQATKNVGSSLTDVVGTSQFNFDVVSAYHTNPGSYDINSRYEHKQLGGNPDTSSATGLFANLGTVFTHTFHSHVGDAFSLNISNEATSQTQASNKDMAQGDIRVALAFGGGVLGNVDANLFSVNSNSIWTSGSQCAKVSSLVPENPYVPPVPEPASIGALSLGLLAAIKKRRPQ